MQTKLTDNLRDIPNLRWAKEKDWNEFQNNFETTFNEKWQFWKCTQFSKHKKAEDNVWNLKFVCFDWIYFYHDCGYFSRPNFRVFCKYFWMFVSKLADFFYQTSQEVDHIFDKASVQHELIVSLMLLLTVFILVFILDERLTNIFVLPIVSK